MGMKKAIKYLAVLPSFAVFAMLNAQQPAERIDKLTFHYNSQRTGWNDKERLLTPANVNDDQFGLIWESPELDYYGDRPPRFQASPLYLDSVEIGDGEYRGGRFAVAYLASTNGWVYAINTAQNGAVKPGTVLWRSQLATKPCSTRTEVTGILSTPIIDPAQNRIYVAVCDEVTQYQVHALDFRTGKDVAGWPMTIDADSVNRPGIPKNGTNRFPGTLFHWQRGALNLSPDKSRLYIAFGKDRQSGWILSVDTQKAAVASAFSTTPSVDQLQGGMWASGGPSIDPEGRIHIASGASFLTGVTRKGGIAGVYPHSKNSWGQSIIQLKDDPRTGFSLIGTYSPFNYCHAAAKDIDLGSSGTIVIDLPASATSTPRLLALGGGKQGNFYLLHRDKMPGSTTKRHECTDDPEQDMSLLAPEEQHHFGKRGPINLFGPYSADIGMLNSAKSRSTAAFFADGKGNYFVFATGSSKTGEDFSTPVPPGLARVRIVTEPGKPAFPRLDALEQTQTMFNPGSPVVTSNGGDDAIVWMIDPNAPRLTSMYGPDAPRPTLYAFEARTMKLLWKTADDELFTGGKYNEPTVVNGLVLVGTDRLQAFGLRPKSAALPPRTRPAAAKPVAAAGPTKFPAGKAAFDQRCSTCHQGEQGAAPGRQALAAMPRERIVTALTTGVMQPIATGMSQEQIGQIADYLKENSN